MKRQFISLAMAGILAASMSITGFADSHKGTTVTYSPSVAAATTVTTGSAIELPSTGSSEALRAYKALQNKLESVKKQLENAQHRLNKAKGKDKKNLENQISAYKKQIEKYTFEMKALLKALNQKDASLDKITDKQESYIDRIEAIIKKSNPTLQMVTAEKIVTDNPIFKSDLPIAVKDGVPYMAQSTLQKSFGITLTYESTQKKFVSKMEGKVVEIFLLQNIMEVDGMPVKSTIKPITIQENIYFPLSDLNKILKVEYKWDNELKVLTLDDLDLSNVLIVPATTTVQ